MTWMTPNLDELEALASAAHTIGERANAPWYDVEQFAEVFDALGTDIMTMRDADALFCVAASPRVVLDLVAALRRVEALADQWETEAAANDNATWHGRAKVLRQFRIAPLRAALNPTGTPEREQAPDRSQGPLRAADGESEGNGGA